LVVGGWLTVSAGHAQFRNQAAAPERLDCSSLACGDVLPGATHFEHPSGRAYATGFADADAEEPVGWVLLSTDVIDVPAYSGHPLVTLIGLRPDGVIAGARVVHHSEPILLVGIPEEALHSFVREYEGKRADARIVVGTAHDEESVAIDMISGATVTALAQNRTILDSARTVGAAVGVVDLAEATPGHFVEDDPPWTWARMVDEGVFGRLTVSESDMGGDSTDAFVDLWFTIADAPQVGRSLLGDADYEYHMDQLLGGQHLFVILGNGSSSFKGSAFVRGGIFDRVRVEQGLVELVFRDTDYVNLGAARAEGAPRFREGALFITRGARLDPGAPFELVFLGSRYDGRGGFTRDHREFSAEHQLPESVYHAEGSHDEPMWVQAWRNRAVDVVALTVFLLLVAAVFAARRWSTADSKRLRIIHLATMAISLAMVGVHLKAQPSVTQILTLLDSVVYEWRFDLFASEPLIFVMWIFTFVVSLVWGRGVFCGWVCPYGALSELIFEVGKKLKLEPRELPHAWHEKARWIRYVVLVGLVPVYFVDSVLAEQLAEIEPFKSTFFVPFWTRQWPFVVWWVALAVVAIVWYRPFCRYLCPLGAGLAILNNFRFLGPKRRKFCSSCKICTRGCEPKAIRVDGTIDQRECLMCMQCEANYRDEDVCPPLIGLGQLMRKAPSERSGKKLDELQEQVKDV
jgi:NosR/NirI family nitrous oxide reductase transcriptional regulator